ncbi:MAG: DNA mismatch repair protein MutS [Planctomycetota bacterium]
MAKEKKKTPMMQQFDAVKEEHPDKIIFFRMGDFYEMFYDDAVKASKILGLTLTSRSKGDNSIPMAGIPYHAAQKYLQALIEAGERVAVCDQMADPSTVKGIVPREITRIVTPGTLVEDSSLESSSNNYLAACAIWKDRAGIACLDLSTGEIFLEEVPEHIALDTLECISAAETLVPEKEAQKDNSPFANLSGRNLGLISMHPDSDFSEKNAAAAVKEFYKVATLDGFGITEDDPCCGALAPVLRYVNETQKSAVRHLRAPKKIFRDDYLILDRASIRNLELIEPIIGKDKKATLFSSINMTQTGAGGRLLRKWMLRPLADIPVINERQQAVREMLERDYIRKDIHEVLSGMADIERIIGRVGCGRVNGRDISALGQALSTLPNIAELLTQFSSDKITALSERLSGLEEIAAKIVNKVVENPPVTITEGGIFRNGCNPELDELRSISSGGKEWIAQYQKQEIERTGINSLKVKYNKVFGYYIEITKTNLAMTPDNYERKQTLVNAERFITPELKEYEEKVIGAEGKIFEIEYQMFLELREEVAEYTCEIQDAAEALSEIDVLASFACLGNSGGYILPSVNNSKDISIKDGRHPVVEKMLPAGEFVPNDCEMHDSDSRVIIVTGPNMAGKSTYIRQSALLLIMAQMGCPIPAASAEIGIADRIFTRVGAADDLARGQSTFMVEMSESANIMNNATERSFIVLDEVGRGTSTFDGVSLAWAITEHIHNKLSARCIFATHYHELAELGIILDGAKNYNVAVRDWNNEIIFLHRIEPGSADKSYGIHVARLAGIPREIIGRAQVIIEGLEEQAEIRDSSILGSTEALRAAAKDVQLTLFDDPDRDTMCVTLADLNPEKMSPEEALAALQSLNAKAAKWRSEN